MSRRQEQRREPIRIAYLALRDASPDATTFPLFHNAAHFPTIQAMWESGDSGFEQSVWDSQLEAIRVDIEEHRGKVRVHAIQKILAATTSQTYAQLNLDPVAYDASTYDDAFFAKPTSYLVCDFCSHHSSALHTADSIGSIDDLIEHQEIGRASL